MKSYIEFKEKNGKIESAAIDPIELDDEVEKIRQFITDNGVAMASLQEERANLYKELDKLLAVRENLP